MERKDCPLLVVEQGQIILGKIDMGEEVLFIGPIAIERADSNMTEKFFKAHYLEDIRDFSINTCRMKILGSGVLLLFHEISGKELSLHDLWTKNEVNEELLHQAQETITKIVFDRQEMEIAHNPYDEELREMDSIQKGSVK